MVIQHNLRAINSHRTLGVNNSQVKKGLEKLSSGYRINRAADDAAGLGISEKMRAQITGLSRAVKNALDGSSLVQTAEGAMQEMHGMLNRMVELATQSANGTLGAEERQKIESELDALKEEIDRVSEATNFNGIKLLNGELDKEWQNVTRIHPSGDVTPVATPGGEDIAAPYVSTLPGGELNGVPDSFLTGGTGPIKVEPKPLTGNSTHLVFSIENRNSPGNYLTYEMDMRPLIKHDKDITYDLDLSPFGTVKLENADAPSVGTRYLVRGLANYLNSLNPQLSVDATEISKTTRELVDIDGLILQVGDTDHDYQKIYVKIPNMNTDGLGISGITMITQEAAASSINSIRDAIDYVSANRGNMGSLQNRLEHTINNLETTVENLTAAESRIRDVDMAKEHMTLTKNQILTESSQSMLAQANMQPQQVLQLLQ
ncbi:flagellin [Ruminococcaceae bacterium OttesenSCG-928-D13]|nr:flagellin [Ruminococcaceae bacterium OttesenSCG-928-D13]